MRQATTTSAATNSDSPPSGSEKAPPNEKKASLFGNGFPSPTEQVSGSTKKRVFEPNFKGVVFHTPTRADLFGASRVYKFGVLMNE